MYISIFLWQCFENVEGRRCDRCKENKYDRQRDCIDCPPCYNLVKDAVDNHRSNLRTLEQLISNISSSDSVALDEDFEKKLKSVHEKVNKLTEDVRSATVGGKFLFLDYIYYPWIKTYYFDC